ncbi:MAG: hypothetical protein ACREO7_07985 [Pseudoxanthomonas sp.]
MATQRQQAIRRLLGGFESIAEDFRVDTARRERRATDLDPIEPDTEDRIDIDSLAFQVWFQGSQMVDESGDPQLFYHGTSADFTEFDHAQIGHGGNAFFFTTDRARAIRYGRNVMVVCLRMRAPLVQEPGQIRADFGVGTPYDGAIFMAENPAFNEYVVSDRRQIKLIRRERAEHWE